MTNGPTALFFLIGFAVLAGYAGSEISRRTRVSDVVFLLLAGLLVGPLLGVASGAALAPALAFLGPFGLMLVLFEGGLELPWRDLREHAGRAVRVSLYTWVATAAAVTLSAHYALGLPWAIAALLGVAICSTGILVVIPLLNELRAPAEARVVLTLETSLGDLLSAVATTTLAAILVLGAPPAEGARVLAFKFAVGAAVGLLAGLAWARVLHHLGDRKNAYALTLAALMLAYLLAEGLGGSGYLMALAFGLVVGNSRALAAEGGIARLASPRAALRATQGEIIFLLRSVYFVYLGLIIPVSAFTLPLLAGGAVVVAAMYLARVLAVRLAFARGAPAAAGDGTRALVTAMMPRGLATALVASIPVAMGVPGTELFPVFTFLVIVGCDVLTSVGVLLYERSRARAPPTPLRVEPVAAAVAAVAEDPLRVKAGER